MSLRFCANEPFYFNNGAIGWRPGGAFDCLGPYAKVEHCPIDGFEGVRRTAYATGYADSFFSIPARTRIRGKWIKGFFTSTQDGCVFVPNKNQVEKLVDLITEPLI